MSILVTPTNTFPSAVIPAVIVTEACVVIELVMVVRCGSNRHIVHRTLENKWRLVLVHGVVLEFICIDRMYPMLTLEDDSSCRMIHSSISISFESLLPQDDLQHCHYYYYYYYGTISTLVENIMVTLR
jgi:hypothetical protein